MVCWDANTVNGTIISESVLIMIKDKGPSCVTSTDFHEKMPPLLPAYPVQGGAFFHSPQIPKDFTMGRPQPKTPYEGCIFSRGAFFHGNQLIEASSTGGETGCSGSLHKPCAIDRVACSRDALGLNSALRTKEPIPFTHLHTHLQLTNHSIPEPTETIILLRIDTPVVSSRL